jgi:hypothetical protein
MVTEKLFILLILLVSIYSTLLNFFGHYTTHILLTLLMNIHE